MSKPNPRNEYADALRYISTAVSFSLLTFICGAAIRADAMRMILIASLSGTATAAGAAMVHTIRDKSGSLQLQVDSLTSENKQLSARLDQEYQDKQQTAETALKLGDELTAAQGTIAHLEPYKSAAITLDKRLKDAIAACDIRLTEQIDQASALLEQTRAEYEARLAEADRRYREDLHREVKGKAVRVAHRIFQNHKAVIGDIQTDLEAVKAERDELKAYLNQVLTQELKEIDQTFTSDWSENEKALQNVIERLQAENVRLSEPIRFMGENATVNRGNKLIDHYWSKGVTLDGQWFEHNPDTDVLYFRLRHADRYGGSPLEVLNDKEDREWIRFNFGLYSPAEWEFCADRYLFKIKLHHSKVKVDKSEITRLWKSKDQFMKAAASWERVRVTGGSESGKSPTAENIAYAILSNREGLAILANPQDDSRKNHWSIAATARNHAESFGLMKDMVSVIDDRASGAKPRNVFNLFMFDETDSTMSEHSSASGYLKSAIKQGSHQLIGLIMIGQSADASNYKGMHRTDFENCVSVHIGSNCYHAIENSNSSQDEKNRLKASADKLTAYCESQNFESGLDKSDPKAYRFALVTVPGNKPQFYELPFFDEVDLKEVSGVKNLLKSAEICSTASSTADGSAVADIKAAVKLLESGKASKALTVKVSASSLEQPPSADFDPSRVPHCPNCNSPNLKNDGKTKEGVQKFKCKDCGKYSNAKTCAWQNYNVALEDSGEAITNDFEPKTESPKPLW